MNGLQPSHRLIRRALLAFVLGISFLSTSYSLFGPPRLMRRLLDSYSLSGALDSFMNRAPPPPAAASSLDRLPVLLGLYTSDSLQVTNWELENFDLWLQENGLDKRISIAGTYMDIDYLNPDWNVHQELDAAWELGYTPFVNLTAYQQKAYQVAFDPEVEQSIRTWAAAFARWSNGGEKKAFIAPLQEMNGGWVRYGLDPVSYKHAFLKIQRIFAEEGVPEDAVSWVFAPNAWSEAGHEFENYYPGDAVVDVVAFSTLNFGGCPDWGNGWDTFETIYQPYLDRMRAMAPGKPIFLAQTGSVAYGPNGEDHKLKDQWLYDTYTKLAAYPGVRAIIYYNLAKAEPGVTKCRPIDWRIYDRHNKIAYQGFLDAVRSDRFAYWAPGGDEMERYVFIPDPQTTFADVVPARPFSGKESAWYVDWIEALARAGLAPGCRGETFQVMGQEVRFEYFCPERQVSRAEAAQFLGLALHGKNFVPPPPEGLFSDVPPDYWAAGWIEQMVRDGLTSGCEAGKFCPEEPLTRAQLAIFLEKARLQVEQREPGEAQGTLFTDVPKDHWAAEWIEQLARSGVTAGCGENEFCPEKTVTRAEMAVFLVKAFDIPTVFNEAWVPTR